MTKGVRFFVLILFFSLINTSGFAQVTELVYPKNQYVSGDSSILFQWNPLGNATAYDLQIADDSLFSQNTQLISTGTASEWQLELDYGQAYFWRVRHYVSGSPQSWSTVWKVIVFSPKDISNLLSWVSADYGVQISNNLITNWQDRSDNGNDFFQTNVSYQPAFFDDILNGKPVIRFDGSNDYLNSSMNILNKNFSVTYFCLHPAATAAVLTHSTTSATKYFFSGFYQAGSKFWISKGNGSQKAGHLCNISDPPGNYIYATHIVDNSNMVSIYSPVCPSSSGTINYETNFDVALGGPLYDFPGDIAEVMLYQKAISTSERQSLEKYLVHKYFPPVNLGKNACGISQLEVGSGYSSYLWSTGDTTNSISISTGGTYWVSVTDPYGNSSVDSVDISFLGFYELPDTNICEGDNLVWDPGLGSGVNYLWQDGSTTTTYNITSTGDYYVDISDANGCSVKSDTASVSVDMFESTVSLGGNANLCSGTNFSLDQGASLVTSYLWSTGATTESITVYTGGDYSVTVTNASGCIARDTATIIIVGVAPTMDFSFDTVCSGDSTSFTDLSTSLPADPIVSWQWIISTGDTLNTQNPKFLFPAHGTYTVELIATTQNGCFNNQSQTVSVKDGPVIGFSYPNPVCSGIPVPFKDISIAGLNDSIVSWSWNFGDGQTSSSQNPAHTYAAIQTYNVELQITTELGCNSNLMQVIDIVNTMPAPQQTIQYYPANGLTYSDTVQNFQWFATPGANKYLLKIYQDSLQTQLFDQQFTSDTNLQIGGMTKGNDYFWEVWAYNYCDDSAASELWSFDLLSPTFIPNLELWFMSSAGVTDDGSGNITEWKDQSPAGRHALQATAGLQPSYSNDSLNSYPLIHFGKNGGASDYTRMDFPKLSLSNGEFSVFSVHKTESIFTIVHYMIAGDNAGFLGGIHAGGTASIIAGFGMYDSAAQVSLHADIEPLNWGIQSYFKDRLFRNGVETGYTSYNTINNIAFNILGLRGDNQSFYFHGDIAEIMIFNRELDTTEQKTIEGYLHNKYGPPPVNLGPDIASSSFCPVQLDAGSRFVSYLWPDSSTNQQFSVTQAGTYWVEVTDAFGYSSTDTIAVSFPTIFQQADTTICSGTNIIWTPGLSGYSYLWQDGSTLGHIDISAAGNYFCTITDAQSCSLFSDTLQVFIDDFANQIDLGNDTAFCAGNVIGLQVGASLSTNYLWSTSETTSTITITSTDGYTVTVSSANGCLATDSIFVTISGVAPNTDFVFDSVCFGDSTHFIDLSTAPNPFVVDQWIWAFGDGDSSTMQNPAHLYSASGTYYVTLMAMTTAGCSKPITDTLIVYTPPTASFSTSSINCVGGIIQFTDASTAASGDSVTSWSWDFGDGNTSTLQNSSHSYSSIGIYTIEITATTANGCSDTYTDSISVIAFAPAATAFNLNLPANNFWTPDTALHFEWEPSQNALKYRLQIATNVSFSQNVSWSADLNTESVDISGLQKGQSYFWRVFAYNACGDSTSSPIYNFNIFGITSFSNMDLWLMADDGVTLDGSNNVGSWTDMSGNGRNAAQLTPGSRPSLTPNSINGLPSVHFGKNGGNNDQTTLDFPAVNYTGGNFTIFLVYKPQAIVSSIHYIVSGGTASTFNGGCHAGGSFTGIDGFGMYDVDANNARNADIEPTNWGIVLHQNDKLTRNGLEPNYSMSADVNNIGLNILGTRSNFTNFFYYGELAEVIVYGHKMTQSEYQSVEYYLRTKYAGPPVYLGPDIYVDYGFCDTLLDAGPRYETYLWSTGETSQTISVNNGGTYWVNVTDAFGYPSTDTIQIFKPSLQIADNNICLNDSALFNTGLNPSEYTFLWSNGATTEFIYAQNAGNYWVQVSDTNGCSIIDTTTLFVDLFANNVSLGPDTAFCAGNYIMIMPGAGPVSSYLWNDGSSDTLLVIQSAGTYSVTVTNPNGCQAIDSINISISGSAPNADFDADSVCFGLSTSFTDLSSTASGTTITGWLWDFGDGDTTSQQNPVHIYANPGVYYVKLRVESNEGCAQFVTKAVAVYPLPEVNFLPDNGCSGQEVDFSDLSQLGLGSIDSWDWNFGDPTSGSANTSSLQHPSHTYATAGTYAITLTVSSNGGCSDSLTRLIEIRESPAVDFSVSQSCFGSPVYFADETQTQPWTQINSWSWDFGDGNVSILQNPSHLFDSAQVYPVSLMVTSINGCSDSIWQNISVNAIPGANFGYPNLCEGIASIFTDSSELSTGMISSWEWNFAGIGTSSMQNPEFAFQDTGQYTVSLTVSSNEGCIDSILQTVYVHEVPEADFEFDPEFGMPPLMVNFSNLTTGAQSYIWYFDDNTSSTIENPDHNFADSGTYYITLVAENQFGCSDTVRYPLYVMYFTMDISVLEARALETAGYLAFEADLINLGTAKISELDLEVEISDGSILRESWSGDLLPGDGFTYSFTTQYMLPPQEEISYVCIKASIPGYDPDFSIDNDRNCAIFTDGFYIADPYPNPADNSINLDVILPFEDQLQIDLYNASGQKAGTLYSGNGKAGLNRITVNLEGLAQGFYTYRVIFRDKVETKNFMKK